MKSYNHNVSLQVATKDDKYFHLKSQKRLPRNYYLARYCWLAECLFFFITERHIVISQRILKDIINKYLKSNSGKRIF